MHRKSRVVHHLSTSYPHGCPHSVDNCSRNYKRVIHPHRVDNPVDNSWISGGQQVGNYIQANKNRSR
ncbi:hypothetical protein EMO91_08885 [Bifidobacterium myosotis]|uniref:Uncharacterized protein n=1 Tax=Bifidobacterium myosotis TaxID=1630166 RepID=A0A5M9ZIW9_9BIFI|nr:hypothetical protein EMO91_08885 [Bifidobacterium myosotis]